MYYFENSIHDTNIIDNCVFININYNNNVNILFNYLLLNFYSNNII
jgi:hypothetical protein